VRVPPVNAPRSRPRDKSIAREPERRHGILALQQAAGNRAVAGYLARKPKLGAPTAVEAAKSALKTSIGGKTASACKARLAKRFPKGPLFTPADVLNVQVLEGDTDGAKWLKEVGIGSHQDAMDYLNAGKYQDWLKLAPGKRLLIATLAWANGIGANDDQPPPSYTLGRAMAIQTGDQQAEQERDESIRTAFVNTLLPQTGQEELEARAHSDDPDEAVAAHGQAQHILTRVLFILHAGLQVYDKTAQQGAGGHVDYKQGDVVRALAHGGRVNIRIPALTGQHAHEDKYALLKWIGVLDAHGHKRTGVKKRDYATHHMEIGENITGAGTGTFKETGGKGASAANKTSSESLLYGVDLAAGGLGKKDFNGDVILPDGAHGHLFIGFTKPTKKKDGALQIGIETTAPGADSLVGYKHNWNSTEATANPESSFFGHKMQKIGGGKLGGSQRLVDLNKVESDGRKWETHLDEIAQLFDDALTQGGPGTERGVYEKLVGPRLF
jgi:Novel toxin 11